MSLITTHFQLQNGPLKVARFCCICDLLTEVVCYSSTCSWKQKNHLPWTSTACRLCGHVSASNFFTILYHILQMLDHWVMVHWCVWITNNMYWLLIIGICIYMLKWPVQSHSFRQPPVTEITCSPVNTLPSGWSSKFRRCSCAAAYTGRKT